MNLLGYLRYMVMKWEIRDKQVALALYLGKVRVHTLLISLIQIVLLNHT